MAVYSVAAYHSSIGAALLVVLATTLLRDHFDPSVNTVSDFTFTLTALSVLAGLEGLRVRNASVHVAHTNLRGAPTVSGSTVMDFGSYPEWSRSNA